MPVEYGEFKGNKLIKLKRNDDDQYPFQFGKGKAKLIVENIDAIKAFVEEAEAEVANAEVAETEAPAEENTADTE
jgi:hypothetical protein